MLRIKEHRKTTNITKNPKKLAMFQIQYSSHACKVRYYVAKLYIGGIGLWSGTLFDSDVGT